MNSINEISLPRNILINNSSYLEKTYSSLFTFPNVNKLKFPGHSQIFSFNYDDLETIRMLASDKCVVLEIRHRPSNKFMAVKRIPIPLSQYPDPQKEARLKKLIREIMVHQKVRTSRYIVNLYGFCIHECEAFICMELMDKSLKDFYQEIHKKFAYFPEDLLGYVSVSLINALRDFQKAGIMHRDIKPTNVLVNNTGEIKLCDFGESRILEDGAATSFAGTIAYLPPERFDLKEVRYDSRSDIWSLGITMAEVILNRLPYANENGEIPTCYITLQRCIVMTQSEDIMRQCLSKNRYPLTENFLKLCLQPHHMRPDCHELMNSQFYTKNLKISKQILAKYFKVDSLLTSKTCHKLTIRKLYRVDKPTMRIEYTHKKMIKKSGLVKLILKKYFKIARNKTRIENIIKEIFFTLSTNTPISNLRIQNDTSNNHSNSVQKFLIKSKGICSKDQFTKVIQYLKKTPHLFHRFQKIINQNIQFYVDTINVNEKNSKNSSCQIPLEFLSQSPTLQPNDSDSTTKFNIPSQSLPQQTQDVDQESFLQQARNLKQDFLKITRDINQPSRVQKLKLIAFKRVQDCLSIRRVERRINDSSNMKLQDFKTSLKTHTRMGCQFQIPSQYDLDYIIGSGSRGIVMRAQDLTKGRKVTIMHRKFPYYRNFVAKRVYREFQLLKVLKHKNITQLIQAYLPQDSTEVYFIMEYVDCPIRVLITEHNKFFQGSNTDHKLFLLLKQLLDGVDYLHQSNVVHGNLTPLNVMINENYELKITNLGYGKVLDEDILVFDTLTRHWTYCAPEMMLGKLYNVKVDIWSVGCIFAELITGKALFKLDDSDGETSIFEIPLDLRLAYGKLNSYLPTEIQNYMNLMKKLLSKHWDEILSDDKFPTDMQSKSLQNARDLLSKMLVIDSEKRLSAKEALEHAYLYRFDYSENIHNETYFKYDERIDSMKLSAEEWTELMINSVKEYESLRLV